MLTGAFPRGIYVGVGKISTLTISSKRFYIKIKDNNIRYKKLILKISSTKFET